ncbi:LapA family protein [Clostridium ganghwense]|uniref:LapA family protein n=1 Tax=Clostridium ganghwense TaxID=312089 RepID=A0ABT4CJQ8_9CLOT|nr:LapA family protein [Clostridium ganghwense]MCY6369285.1 LapA family protein [Clostridium ganghwense]
MRIGFILSLLFGVIVTIFAVQNAETVSINFFSNSIKISQALVIFISAISGALIITLLGLYREFRMKLKIRQQTKIISQLEKEISECKTKLDSSTQIISNESSIKNLEHNEN